MSNIVLSASVRQNLLSLQSTAALLATTQNDLATGKQVNSALDNPTNFFTAAGLDNRASDIGNLLDSIGNGVQVLQAANTGITSLQSLIDSAKSVANQALQAPVAFSQKSSVTANISGGTSTNLLGNNSSFNSAVASSNALFDAKGAAITAAGTLASSDSAVFTGVVADNNKAAAITANTTLAGAAGTDSLATTGQPTAGQTLTVDGHTITFAAGDVTPVASLTGTQSEVGNVVTDGAGNSTVFLGGTAANSVAGKVGDLLNAIDLATGAQKITAVNAGVATLAATAGASTAAASITAGAIKLTSGEGADLSITGQANLLVALGLSTATGVNSAVTVGASRAVTATSGILGTLIQGGSTLTVDGKTITFSNVAPPITATIPSGSSTVGGIQTDGKGNSTVFLQTATAGDILNAIDLATGVQSVKSVSAAGVATLQTTNGQANSTLVGGQLEIQTGTQSDLSISGTGNALSALGLTGPTGQSGNFTASRGTAVGGIAGKTLTFSSFNGGTAVNVTFGTGVGQVQNLAQLNTALQSNNLSASIDGSGNLTISATNDFASSTLGSPAAGGTIGGSITNAISFSAPTTPIADQAASATRAGLVTQFNNILSQISTTTQDSSFNGINLLNGDQLKLTFDETGKSTLSITGVTFDSAGLGLSQLTQGVDFIDNNATNKVLNTLSAAATTLRSEASTLGSNLSIVEIRQDFNKNLINVLQTGSSNLTLADPNAEAANSQALTTRQQIAVSALALANQSQQSVLQLLR